MSFRALFAVSFLFYSEASFCREEEEEIRGRKVNIEAFYDSLDVFLKRHQELYEKNQQNKQVQSVHGLDAVCDRVVSTAKVAWQLDNTGHNNSEFQEGLSTFIPSEDRPIFSKTYEHIAKSTGTHAQARELLEDTFKIAEKARRSFGGDIFIDYLYLLPEKLQEIFDPIGGKCGPGFRNRALEGAIPLWRMVSLKWVLDLDSRATEEDIVFMKRCLSRAGLNARELIMYEKKAREKTGLGKEPASIEQIEKKDLSAVFEERKEDENKLKEKEENQKNNVDQAEPRPEKPESEKSEKEQLSSSSQHNPSSEIPHKPDPNKTSSGPEALPKLAKNDGKEKQTGGPNQ